MIKLKSLRKSGIEQYDRISGNAVGEDASMDPPIIGNSFQEIRPPEDVLNLQTKERIIVEFNSEGEPIGVEGVLLRRFCGVLATDGSLCPLNYTDWRKMPTKYKEKMMNDVQKKFIMGKENMDKEIDHSRWILRSINSSWRMWKSKLKATNYHSRKSKRELLRNVPKNVNPSQWCQLIKYWNSTSAKLKRKSNMAGCEKKKKVTKITTTQKKKQNIIIPTLHEAIFFDMLTWLPAQYLYDSLRYVCSSWSSIINNPHFAETHLRRSKFGLLVENAAPPYEGHFLEFEDNGVIKISRRWTNSQYPGLVWGCCGGLSLLHDFHDFCVSGTYVANLVTRKAVKIPDSPSKFISIVASYGIARVPHTGICKLACVVYGTDNGVRVIKFLVYTVGIDKSWRVMDYSTKYEHTSLPSSRFGPVSVGEFIFWTETAVLTDRVIAMDVDNESIHLVRSPLGHRQLSGYLRMGNYLSCVKYENSVHYMHVLTDVKLGKWVLSHKFAITWPSEFLFPHLLLYYICYLGNSQELIFSVIGSRRGGKHYFAFSLKTQQLRCISNYFFGRSCRAFVHTSGLVSWKTL